MSEDEVLTAREVAEWLRLSESQVNAKARAGELPSFTVGRWRRFRRTSVQAWLDEQERLSRMGETEQSGRAALERPRPGTRR